MIRPFILSQVGERQNELVFSPDELDLLKLSEIIYEFFDKLKEKKSFFRCVKCKNQIISAYYWKSCIPELKSGRLGLYVIIGFIVPVNEFKFQDFLNFSSSFFRSFENHFSVNLKNRISDSFFLQIQNNTTEKMDIFLKEYNSVFYEYLKKEDDNNYLKLNKDLRILKYTNAFIYMMNYGQNFYDDWASFIYESYLIMKKKKKVDISTLKGYTSFSFRILQNGEKIYNSKINKIVIPKNPVCRYLIIYLKN